MLTIIMFSMAGHFLIVLASLALYAQASGMIKLLQSMHFIMKSD